MRAATVVIYAVRDSGVGVARIGNTSGHIRAIWNNER